MHYYNLLLLFFEGKSFVLFLKTVVFKYPNLVNLFISSIDEYHPSENMFLFLPSFIHDNNLNTID